VSLSWRKELRVGFGADQLIVSDRVIPVQRAPQGPEWLAAAEALAEALGAPARARPRVTVVLANHLVRYALLPWNETLKSGEQWMALARHRLAAIHGSASAEWDVRIAETGPRGARVVAAVERGLLQALDEKLAAAGASLGSVQPYLMTAFNPLRGRAALAAWWLVIEEPGRLTLALLSSGAWLALRTRRVDSRWRELLPDILERENALLGVDAPATQVLVCTQSHFDPEMHEAFRLEAVDYGELAMAGA
jgi:hypothetical protein